MLRFLFALFLVVLAATAQFHNHGGFGGLRGPAFRGPAFGRAPVVQKTVIIKTITRG